MIKSIILCVLGLATSVVALSQHLSGYELERAALRVQPDNPVRKGKGIHHGTI